MSFDPAKYLRKLGKADYLEVRWRLVWFRDEHPDGFIRTQLERFDGSLAGKSYAIFRAEVGYPLRDGENMPLLDGSGAPLYAMATGYGSEEQKDFNDYLEKAETKAIGRALAALGYGTQFTDDFDRPDDRPVDSPTERPPHAPSGQATRGTAAQQRAAAPTPSPAPASATTTQGHPSPANVPVMEVGGVRFIVITTKARGQVYQTVETCAKDGHGGSPFYAQVNAQSGQLSEWSHKLPDGSLCHRA